MKSILRTWSEIIDILTPDFESKEEQLEHAWVALGMVIFLLIIGLIVPILEAA